MQKSTVIASCLVNSKMMDSLEQAERAVRTVFREDFPTRDFALWNTNLDDASATNIIRTVGKATTINVKLFIEDLA